MTTYARKIAEAVRDALVWRTQKWAQSTVRFYHEPPDSLVQTIMTLDLDAIIAGVPETQAAESVDDCPASLPFAILPEEMAALKRFHECVTDGEGYDIPREMMKRLSEIGLVRRVTANVYEHTNFGLAVLAGDFAPQPSQPAASEAARDAKDAARYRWMRSRGGFLSMAFNQSPEDFDAAIDTMIERLDRAEGE